MSDRGPPLGAAPASELAARFGTVLAEIVTETGDVVEIALPLSVTWWQADGSFRSATDMVPCTEEDPNTCARYPATGPYLHAVVVPQGSLVGAGIDASSRLRVLEDGCKPT